MHVSKHIVVVAGEESGDRLAALFVEKLKHKFPKVKWSGIGGHHLKGAGVTLISDLALYGVTGTIEVLKHLYVIKKAYHLICNHLLKQKPDLLILIDYPGFNLRLAKFAKKKLKTRVLYYISPQIWAWKAGRIHHIRRYVDHMAVILPFEKILYQKAGVPASFVGHPLVERINQINISANLSEPFIIALLPGSRSNELKYHLPILQKTALLLTQSFPSIKFLIPLAFEKHLTWVDTYFKNTPISYNITIGNALSTLAQSHFAIVASGTASLECALLQIPMCIIYKTSFFTYLIATLVIKVKYLGLSNLLVNSMIVPEFLQYDCSSTELSKFVTLMLTHYGLLSDVFKSKLLNLKTSLSSDKADLSIEALLEKEILSIH